MGKRKGGGKVEEELMRRVGDCREISEAYKKKHREMEELYLNYYLLERVIMHYSEWCDKTTVKLAVVWKETINKLDKSLVKAEKIEELKMETDDILKSYTEISEGLSSVFPKVFGEKFRKVKEKVFGKMKELGHSVSGVFKRLLEGGRRRTYKIRRGGDIEVDLNKVNSLVKNCVKLSKSYVEKHKDLEGLYLDYYLLQRVVMDYQIRCGEVTDRVERVVSRVVGEDIRTGRKLEEMTGGIIEDYRGYIRWNGSKGLHTCYGFSRRTLLCT